MSAAPLRPTRLPSYNTDHHVGDHFQNIQDENYPDPGHRHMKFSNVFKALWSQDVVRPILHRSLVTDLSNLPDGIRMFWIGHATCLVQVHDVFILTDPIFGHYAAPVPGIIGRRTPLPCTISDLPNISVVLVSHCHWDHLDKGSIRDLANRFPNLKVFAPLKCADLIRGWNFRCDVVEFDWREAIEYQGIKYTCCPARHQTARFGYDKNKYLWCSWLISSPDVVVYFPGDTAAGGHFAEVKEVSERPVDLALMPIGPQEPKEMMRLVHMNPEDAMVMSRMLGARTVVPIHYGVFSLGAHPEVDDLTLLRSHWESGGEGIALNPLPVGGYVEWNGQQFAIREEGFRDATQ